MFCVSTFCVLEYYFVLRHVLFYLINRCLFMVLLPCRFDKSPPRQDPPNAQLAQALAQLTHVMTQQAQASAAQNAARDQREAEENIRRAHRHEREMAQVQARMQTDFNRQDPPKFSGEVEPEKADIWIQETEKIFEVLQTPAAEKVGLATFQLKGDAGNGGVQTPKKDVICYKCQKMGHYANECDQSEKVCWNCQ